MFSAEVKQFRVSFSDFSDILQNSCNAHHVFGFPSGKDLITILRIADLRSCHERNKNELVSESIRSIKKGEIQCGSRLAFRRKEKAAFAQGLAE